MTTRRDFLLEGSVAAIAAFPAFTFVGPSHAADAYSPPKKSQGVLKGVRFDKAKRVGEKYAARFARWDALPASGKDPNCFKVLLEIPNGKQQPALYWDAKMAVDADGASPEVRKQSSGASQDTSYHFADGTGLNAEVVPYFVVPTYDDPTKVGPGRPWEGSGDSFVADCHLRHGNLGVVIFGSKVCGAIFGDEGPPTKIGEASIRVHERIRRLPLPWKGDPAKKILKDASEERNVLYFVFRDTFFDIEKFGSGKQKALGEEVHKQGIAAFHDFIKAQV
jgi:hypothetical protein